MSGRIVIAGGSGFLGRTLCRALLSGGYEVTILTRSAPAEEPRVRHVPWDGATVGDWAGQLEGAKAVVNLAGRSVNCRQTAENRRQILESRVNSAGAIAQAIARCAEPPEALVQASAVGIYGNAGDRICDENAPVGEGFMADLCRQWEAAASAVGLPRTRRCILRIGLVLGRGGGALPVLMKLARWFLGGRAGSGRQYVSWIHVADLVRMVEWCIGSAECKVLSAEPQPPGLSAQNSALSAPAVLRGVFNAVAPTSITNDEFMRELRRAVHRPWSPPAPSWAVRLGAWVMGTNGELALGGQRCVPGRFLEAGFEFRFPEVRGAVEEGVGLSHE